MSGKSRNRQRQRRPEGLRFTWGPGGLPGAVRGVAVAPADHDDRRVDRLCAAVEARGWTLLDHMTAAAPLDAFGLPAGDPDMSRVWVTHSVVDGAGRTLVGPATVEECEAYLQAAP